MINKKHLSFLIPLSVLYLLFSALDIAAPHMYMLSNITKNTSICICFAASLLLRRKGMQPYTAIAMIFTVVADAGLLFLNTPAPFVAFFITAQCFHGLSMSKLRMVIITLACSMVLGIIIYAVIGDTLMSISVSYSVMLLYNVINAVKKHKRPGGTLASIGFILFLCCDICVALYNIGMSSRLVQVMMWGFYLPSQMLIVFSSVQQESQQ